MTVIALLVALALTVQLRAGEVIDRVLAVVGGELILLSDAAAALRFGLVEAPPEGADPTGAALNALIDRQLQLFEVQRYVPPEPVPAAVDAQVAAVRARFPTAEAFQAALDETGMTEGTLRSRVRDTLRIASYRSQRFAAALEPTDEDLLRYYRLREAEFTRDGVLQPFAEVRDQLRKRVADERSASLINEWLSTLRRRADVQVLYTNR